MYSILSFRDDQHYQTQRMRITVTQRARHVYGHLRDLQQGGVTSSRNHNDLAGMLRIIEEEYPKIRQSLSLHQASAEAKAISMPKVRQAVRLCDSSPMVWGDTGSVGGISLG